MEKQRTAEILLIIYSYSGSNLPVRSDHPIGAEDLAR